MQKKCILDVFGHYFLNKMTLAEKKKTQGERWEMKKKERGMSPILNVYTTE